MTNKRITGELNLPVNDTTELVDSSVNEQDIYGFIHKIRKLGKVAFLQLRTNKSVLQIVLEGDTLALADSIKEGDYAKITGTLSENPRALPSGKEIHATQIAKLAGPTGELSLNVANKINANLDVLLDNRVLTLRNLEIRSIFRLQEGIGRGFKDFLVQNGFTEIHTPKIVKAGAEGGSNIFELDYFGTPAFLAQSPQFYKQYMVPVFGRVFEVGPVFRAEKHGTSRHLNEYTSMDIEMGPINSFRDIMNMETAILRYIINLLRSEYSEDIARLGITLPDLSRGIPEIKFSEIKEIVASKYKRPFRDKHDLEPEEERLIGRYAKEELGSDFVFITNYPEQKRPFYTMLSPDDVGYTEGFDLLFNGLEITTGGQRIHDYNTQVERLIAKGLDPADFSEYLLLHKNGTMPHGGFGIGLERLTQRLIGADNIRMASLFPRDINRLTP